MNKFKGDDIIENNYIIYMHVSPSNKRYIGITSQKSVKKRWQNGKGYKTNRHFYRAIEKYGWDNFQHIIVARGLDEETAKWLEIELIREWDTTNPNKGYNVNPGGNIISEETKQKISEGNKGKVISEETKQKMSESRKGENNPFYGKGYLRTKEDNPFYGKNHTKETKEKISKAKKGGSLSEETKQKISEGNKGKVISEETKQRLREVNKGGNNPNARKIICITTGEIFSTITEGAKKYNCDIGSVAKCCKGKQKSCGIHPITKEKLIWMYYEDYLKLIKKEND